MQRVLANVMVASEQREGDGLGQHRVASWATVADVGDGDDGCRAAACNRGCLGGSWITGACVCERRGRGEVSSDGNGRANFCALQHGRAPSDMVERRGHGVDWPFHGSSVSGSCMVMIREVRGGYVTW